MKALSLQAHARALNRYRRWMVRDDKRIRRAGFVISVLGSNVPVWLLSGAMILILGRLAGLWILVPAIVLAPATLWLFIAQCTHLGWDGGKAQ